jgi:hypothetical protein
LLDRNTCKPCTAVDGVEMQFGSARQKELAPPYRKCSGGDNCRCTQLYIYENPRDRAREGVRLDDRDHLSVVSDVGRQIASTLRDAQSRQRADVHTHVTPEVHTDVHLPEDHGRVEDVEFEYRDDGLVSKMRKTITPLNGGNGHGGNTTGAGPGARPVPGATNPHTGRDS